MDPLDEIFDGSVEDMTPPSTPRGPVTIGKRTWKTWDDFVKSHENLQKAYTQASQSAAKYKQFDEFNTYLNQNPKLRDKLNGIIGEYQGATTGQAQPDGETQNQDPAWKSEMQTMKQKLDAFQLRQEMDAVRSKYNLDDEGMNKILKESRESGGIPLEKAYRIVNSDELYAKHVESLKAKESEEASKVKAADVGASDTTEVTPAPKDIGKMSEAEFMSEGSKMLGEFGVTEDE